MNEDESHGNGLNIRITDSKHDPKAIEAGSHELDCIRSTFERECALL
jgi:hypothetical protein